MKKLHFTIFLLLAVAGCSEDNPVTTIAADYTTNKQLFPLEEGRVWKYLQYNNSVQQPDTVVVETTAKYIGLFRRVDTTDKVLFIDSTNLYTLSNNSISDYDFAASGQFVRMDSGLASVDYLSGFYLYTQIVIPKKIVNGTEIMYKGYPHKATALAEFRTRFKTYYGCWELTPTSHPNLSRKIFHVDIGLLEERFIENGDTVRFELLP